MEYARIYGSPPPNFQATYAPYARTVLPERHDMDPPIAMVVPYSEPSVHIVAMPYATTQSPVLLDQAGCQGCGACSNACPTGALMMTDRYPSLNFAGCTACGRCIGVCPQGALSLSQSIPGSRQV